MDRFDPCPGTFSTVKDCMMKPSHRRFVGYEMDAWCCKASLLYLIQVFLRTVFYDKSDVVDELNVQAVEKVLVLVPDKTSCRRKEGSLRWTACFVSISIFLPQLLAYFQTGLETRHCMRWGRYLCSQNGHKSGSRGSTPYSVNFNVYGFGERWVSLKKRLILHLPAGHGIFAAKQFE